MKRKLGVAMIMQAMMMRKLGAAMMMRKIGVA